MRYFTKIYIVLVLMWGAVGLERLVAAFVLPGIQKEFALNYTQAGAVIAVFGLAWAIGTWGMGSLSDYVGRKPVIVVLVIFGGVCSWLTGLASSFIMLIVIRAVMGFAEGGIWGPTSAIIAEESSPMKRARNLGFLPGVFTLTGAAIGPILSTQLMVHYGWRFVFYIYAIPAVVLGILIWTVLKETASTQATLAARRSGSKREQRLDAEGRPISYWDVWKYRNILLLMATWAFNMAFLWLFTSFGTLFMAKVHQIPITTVGLIMSGFGFGAFLGAPILGMVSDHIGRRWSLVFFQLVAGVFAIIFVTFHPGVGTGFLFPFIFIAAFFSCAVTPVLLSVSTETVGFAMAATAIGAVTGVGELIGGGILPIIAGGIADKIGLNSTLYLAGALLIAGAVCGLFIKETAPKFLEKRREQTSLTNV
jgi:MFS family permease